MDTNIKILMADDSAFMRKILKDILTQIGFSNFIEAENGKEAIEKVNSENPDLVLLDVVMPEIDGIEVVKTIGRKVKVLMVSAVGQEDVITEAKEHGALGYIIKPFDRNKVEEQITIALT